MGKFFLLTWEDARRKVVTIAFNEVKIPACQQQKKEIKMTCSCSRQVLATKRISCFSLVLLFQLAGISAHADTALDFSGNPLGMKGIDQQDSLAYRRLDALPEEKLAASANATDIFATYQKITVGSWPEAVAIGDVNHDGKNDVVLTTSSYSDPVNDYKLFVFLQNSSGGLSSPTKYPAGNGDSVDIADLNNDGRNDVVVTDNNAIGVFLQNADGTLASKVLYSSAHSSFSNTYKVKTGDFNSDGLMDVVSIDWGTQSHNVDVYLQNNSGTLNVPATYVVEHGGYDDLEIGDVNHDGLTDIIVMSGQSYAHNNFGILLQNFSGLFNSPVYYDLGGDQLTQGIAVGDINNDARQDVIVTYGGNKPSSFIAAFQQNNSATLNNAISYASYDIPESVAITDINNDQRNDVILLHGGWNKAGVYYQRTDSTLDAEVLYSIPYASHYNPHGLAVGDLNGDGSSDIAIADYNNGLVLLYNTLPAAPSSNPEIDITGNSLTIADGDTTPSSADHTSFGSATTGAPVSRVYTIANTGDAVLNLTGTPFVKLSGAGCAEFSVTQQPTVPLAAGGTTAFTVQYNPADTGSDTCSVVIDNDDSDENPYNFNIQGTANSIIDKGTGWLPAIYRLLL